MNHGASSALSELCLRHPDTLQYPQVTYENAVSLLMRALQISATTPFIWGHIDRPSEGNTFIVFMVPQQTTFPNDGIRYQEQEQRFVMATGAGRDLEVSEIKSGFIPESQDTAAFRVRRRFRLIKGGNPQLMVVHYSRGQPTPIIPTLLSQPVRAYPLRAVNEPPVFVLGGDRHAQKVISGQAPGVVQMGGGAMPSSAAAMGMGAGPMGAVPIGAGMGMGDMAALAGVNPHALLAAQNRDLQIQEQRQQQAARLQQANQMQQQALQQQQQQQQQQQIAQRERDRERSAGAQQQPRVEDEDSGDDQDQISTQALALARYKRNHECMNAVFMHAALGDKKPPPRPSPYACFNLEEVQAKIAKLTGEVEALRAQTEVQRQAREQREREEGEREMGDEGDVSMHNFGASSDAVVQVV